MNKEQDLKVAPLLIEQTLQAFGIYCRIAKAIEFENSIQYCMELALGTPAKDFVDREKDLAISLKSPTGYVEIEVPIPKTSYIGINLPKNDKYEKGKKGKLLNSYKIESNINESTYIKKTKLGNAIYNIGYYLIAVSSKMQPKEKN